MRMGLRIYGGMGYRFNGLGLKFLLIFRFFIGVGVKLGRLLSI